MKSVASLLLRSRTRVFLVNLAEPDSEPTFFAKLKWNPDGLIPAIVQDAESGEVLMMAWMDELSLKTTMTSGQTHFYSRSRRLHWHKGESSGHVQDVVSIHVDCDADVILIKARQVGGACHEGYRSCFFRKLDQDGSLHITETPVFLINDVYGSK